MAAYMYYLGQDASYILHAGNYIRNRLHHCAHLPLPCMSYFSNMIACLFLFVVADACKNLA
jgi:hypothetical protein